MILPSLNSLTIFSIPKNFKLSPPEANTRVIISRGSEAIKSTTKRPKKTYRAAILFAIIYNFISVRVSVHRSEIY